MSIAAHPLAASRTVGGSGQAAMSLAELGTIGPIGGDPATFRLLRDKLLAGPWGEAIHRALAVVSVDPGDGRSYVCADLALSLSQLGRRTLLIDADTERPSLHALFSADNSRGLSDLLLSRAEPAACIRPLPALPLLALLPSGPLPAQPLRLQRQRPLRSW